MSDENVLPSGDPGGEGAPAPEAGQDKRADLEGFNKRLLREQRELKAKLTEYETRAKQAEESNLSELDKAKRALAELEPYRAKTEQLAALVQSQREELLGSLPADAVKALGDDFETWDLPQQIRTLRALAATHKTAAPAAPSVRSGNPVQPQRLPSLQELQNNRDLMKTLTPEQKAEVYRQAGIPAGGDRVLGRK